MSEHCPAPPNPVTQAVCLPCHLVWAASPAHILPDPLTTPPVCCTLRTQTHTRKLVTAPFLAFQQILGPLDHDDQCGKQKLAYKLEQVITLMSLDS